MRALIGYVSVLTGLRLLVCCALLSDAAIAADPVDVPCKSQKFWRVEVSELWWYDGNFESPNHITHHDYRGKYTVGGVAPDEGRWESWDGPRGGFIQKQARLMWYAPDADPNASKNSKIPNGPSGVWVLEISGDDDFTFYLLGAEWKCDGANAMKPAPIPDGSQLPSKTKVIITPTSKDNRGRDLI